MEIKTLLGGLGQYEKTKLEKSESEPVRGKKDNGSVESKKGDTVTFSDAALLRTEAHKAASAAPDVRRDKVEAIKAQIANGSYVVDSRKIAERILVEDAELLS